MSRKSIDQTPETTGSALGRLRKPAAVLAIGFGALTGCGDGDRHPEASASPLAASTEACEPLPPDRYADGIQDSIIETGGWPCWSEDDQEKVGAIMEMTPDQIRTDADRDYIIALARHITAGVELWIADKAASDPGYEGELTFPKPSPDNTVQEIHRQQFAIDTYTQSMRSRLPNGSARYAASEALILASAITARDEDYWNYANRIAGIKAIVEATDGPIGNPLPENNRILDVDNSTVDSEEGTATIKVWDSDGVYRIVDYRFETTDALGGEGVAGLWVITSITEGNGGPSSASDPAAAPNQEDYTGDERSRRQEELDEMLRKAELSANL